MPPMMWLEMVIPDKECIASTFCEHHLGSDLSCDCNCRTSYLLLESELTCMMDDAKILNSIENPGLCYTQDFKCQLSGCVNP
jgi:hypothetical protein